MEQAHFRAIISAIDLASAPLRRIRENIEATASPVAGVQRSLASLGAEISGISRAAGFTRIADAAHNAASRVGFLGRQVTGLIAPLGALGAVGSIAGLVSIVHAAAEAGGGLNDLYGRLGAVSDAQRGAIGALRYSALQTGATVEDVSGGLVRLNRVLAEARSGSNQDAVGLFRALGIGLRDAAGNARSAADLIPDLAKAMVVNEDPGIRERILRELMGRGGGALINALAEYEEQAARVRRFGAVFSRADITSLDAYGDAFEDVRVAVTGVRNAIGAQLAPVLTPLLEDLSLWIASNRALIASEVREFVTDLATKLRQVDFAALRQNVLATVSGISRFITAIGGIRTVMIAAAAVIAGPFIASILAVGQALVGLGLALLANPIAAAIVAAVAAIAGAAYLIYRNWDSIAGFFTRIWGRIRDGFGPQAAWLRDTVVTAFTGAAEVVRNVWEGLVQVFAGVWHGITDPFVQMWETIRPILDELGMIGDAAPRGQGRATDPAEQAQRRGRFGGRGAAGGFYEQGGGLYIAPQGGQSGAIDVRVRFEDAPPGTRVDAEWRGDVRAPQLELGYALTPRFN